MQPPTLAATTETSALRFDDVRLPDGVRLRYAEQGDPAGAPVVFLHGYSDSWFSFSPVLPLLPPAYHAFAPDQRGHGASDRPEDGYAMRDLAADAVAFMDAVGLERATVVGHSMGSLVAQQVALAAPERVERLVLVGAGPDADHIEGIDDLDRAVAALRDPVPADFVRDFQAGTVHQPVPAAFMDRAITESLQLPARVWRAVLAGMRATAPATGLRDTPIPTLVLWGERDVVFLRAAQDALLALVPQATLKVYPETGHALHWERPEAFVRDLGAFVTGAV